ncbi:MAG: LOG family protein [Proteobacteria bacterium]|nr:LOG family protein [Pseudomonadota bacterium]
MNNNTETTRITPHGQMEILSQVEVNELKQSSEHDGSYDIFRRCSLAVLNVGSTLDDSKKVLEQYQDFNIRVVPQERGIKLEFENAPTSAYVDGQVITGIQEQLFSVLRDVVFIRNQIDTNQNFDLNSSDGITNAVFHILRNAKVLLPETEPNLVVCWGGHSISRKEYDYTKEVGYQLGLRGLDICTGCGPGAMKGPMKGATIGHAKQRIYNGRYIGITEPGIIAAESPNPIVNELVIMPDIEKRLEGFVRTGHGIIVFPGGVGTTEEILFFLGVLLNPANSGIPFPLILTGPECSRNYFDQIDRFIQLTLGRETQKLYQIIIGEPDRAAREIGAGIETVRNFRRQNNDAYYYNWMLKIDSEFQQPFNPTHENVAQLRLDSSLPRHQLAANLRRAFSSIVAGNVKDQGIRLVEQYGPYEIKGEAKIMGSINELLGAFVQQKRMKAPGTRYAPCYRLIND